MEKIEFKNYLKNLFDDQKKKWGYDKNKQYGWEFPLCEGSDWKFTVDWNRDNGVVLGHCNTRVQVSKDGWVWYNIYCYDYGRNKATINYMSTYMWNRMTCGDISCLYFSKEFKEFNK